MNLETSRARQHFEAKTRPEKMQRLATILGANLELEIDWSGFTNKDDVAMLANGFFDRLIHDLEKLCKDKLGRDAFTARIKKLVVKCVGSAAEKRFEIVGAALIVYGAWGKSEGYIGYDAYRKYFEQNL